MAEGLLQMISSYNNIQGSVGGNSGITVVPQGGTTQEVIKEVQVPVETIVTQTFSNLQFRNVPTIDYVMILLMGAAVLTMPIPVIFYLLHKRKRNPNRMVRISFFMVETGGLEPSTSCV